MQEGYQVLCVTKIQMALIPGPVRGLIESTGPVRMRLFISG